MHLCQLIVVCRSFTVHSARQKIKLSDIFASSLPSWLSAFMNCMFESVLSDLDLLSNKYFLPSWTQNSLLPSTQVDRVAVLMRPWFSSELQNRVKLPCRQRAGLERPFSWTAAEGLQPVVLLLFICLSWSICWCFSWLFFTSLLLLIVKDKINCCMVVHIVTTYLVVKLNNRSESRALIYSKSLSAPRQPKC